jgi:uncharacterized membrane protein YfcA
MFDELFVGVASIAGAAIMMWAFSTIGHPTLGLIFGIALFAFGIYMLWRQAT